VLRQGRTKRDLFGGAADGWLFIPADADPAARLGVRFDLRALKLKGGFVRCGGVEIALRLPQIAAIASAGRWLWNDGPF